MDKGETFQRQLRLIHATRQALDPRYAGLGGELIVPHLAGGAVAKKQDEAVPKTPQASVTRQEQVLARLKRLGAKTRGRPQV